MMKKTLLIAALAAWGLSVHGQGILEVTPIEDQAIGVLSGHGEMAEITLKADISLPLKIEENVQGTNFELKTDTLGSEVTYTTYLKIYPANYGQRYLTLFSSNFDPYYVYLPELSAYERRAFRVTDANGTVGRGCYLEHRQKGTDAMKARKYEDAKNEFILAGQCVECTDVYKTENDTNIDNCDSLIVWTAKADEFYRLNLLYEAAQYYQAIKTMNDYDDHAKDNLVECTTRFNAQCDRMMENIAYARDQRDWKRMQQEIDMDTVYHCSKYSVLYKNSISRYQNSLDQERRKKSEHPRVITYEWRKDVPIGIHYGTYNMHKVGGFFQLDFNTTVFDAARSDLEYEDPEVVDNIKYAEANIAAGWTLKIRNPVWIHFTPIGATAKVYYGKYEKNNYPYYKDHALDSDMYSSDPDVQKRAREHANVAFAWSPVVGITAKYSYFALRVTYQYRFSIKKGLQEFIEPHRVSVGVGVAF